jgi:hypothetical protein
MLAMIKKASIAFFLVAAFGTSVPVSADECEGWGFYCYQQWGGEGWVWACTGAVHCAFADECWESLGCESYCLCETCSPYNGPEGTAICPE